MGPSTHRLDLLLSAPRRDTSPLAEDDMIAAFCSAQQLGQLLCLHADIFSYDSKVAQTFLVWLLKCAPNLVALDLLALNVHLSTIPCPPPCLLGLKSLRHLQLGRDNLPCIIQSALQLPVLQTLCIHGYHSELHEVNLLGCPQLSLLVMKGCNAQRVLLNPACHFSADLGMFRDIFERVWWASLEPFLCSIHELSLDCQETEYTSTDNRGLFAGLPRLAVLKVAWPERRWGWQEPKRDKVKAGTECLLTNCLKSDGPPVLSLRVIIITAISMQARIPGHLPNLEQLLIFSEGRAELSFEKPEATILALKKFHAFGQPLKPDGMDILRMSTALAGTKRALGGASAQKAGKGFRCGSSCLYLRPAAAEALPMQRLYDLVAGHAILCRCGACFDCLSRAGHLEL